MLHNNLQTTLGVDVDRLEAHRHFYADLVTTSAGAATNERLKEAFASTPRERFVGAGPWKVFAGGNYVETPSDDPAFLYQDVVVALAPERRINVNPAKRASCHETVTQDAESSGNGEANDEIGRASGR